MTLSNSTVSGNSAAGTGGAGGGGISNVGTLTLINSTVNGNNAGTNGGGIFNIGTLTLTSSTVSPQLGPLQNNGGPTQTHALLAGSPAIDAGNPNGCRDQSGALLLKDQRGFRRTVDGDRDGTARCDIGAVEFGSGAGVRFNFNVDFDGIGETT